MAETIKQIKENYDRQNFLKLEQVQLKQTVESRSANCANTSNYTINWLANKQRRHSKFVA